MTYHSIFQVVNVTAGPAESLELAYVILAGSNQSLHVTLNHCEQEFCIKLLTSYVPPVIYIISYLDWTKFINLCTKTFGISCTKGLAPQCFS